MTRPGIGTTVLVLAAAVRLLVAALVPLHPDEAYYWEWSRHLAGGYFDHPPAIAWVIRSGTALLGDTPLGVRFVPVLAGLVAGWAVMRTASRLAGNAAGDAAALAFVALPVMSGVFVLATPDAPLLAFAALTLWAVGEAVASPAPRERLAWWMAAGVGAGLAMASKYTGVILPLALLAALLGSRSLRPLLNTAGPWLALPLSFLVFFPVMRWNALHDWSSFRFQLNHGLGGSIDAGAVVRELELLGGQVLLASPVLFVLGMAALERAFRGEDKVEKVLVTVAIVTGALFAYSALRNRVEANWPAIAWVPIACLLGSTSFAGSPVHWRRIGLGLGFLFTAVLYAQAVVHPFPVPARRDPTARAYGWSDLARAADRAADALAQRPWLAANRYQDAAELAFSLPERPEVFSLNLGGRDNQYRYWPGFPERARPGDDLLLVLGEVPDSVADPAITALAGLFGSVEKGRLVEMHRGGEVLGRRRLWLLRDWRGAWPGTAQ